MLLLAFGNKARQGKDTAGEAVVNYYNTIRANADKNYGRASKSPAQLFKFADALYQECRDLHGMTEKDAPLLQRVGHERRQENPNYWIDKVFAQIDKASPEIAVLTDLRYQNESTAVSERGGFTIQVSRLNRGGSPYVAGDRPANHPSEIDLDGSPFDFFIKAYTGDAALVEQLAITIAEFARSLKS